MQQDQEALMQEAQAKDAREQEARRLQEQEAQEAHAKEISLAEVQGHHDLRNDVKGVIAKLTPTDLSSRMEQNVRSRILRLRTLWPRSSWTIT